MINIKIYGNRAVGSAFVLHQYERASGGSGGPQSQNAMPVGASQPIMTIYPTTVRNNFTIEFSLANKSQIAIELYDITGRLIKELFKNDITAGKQRLDFSASDLPTGIYFIQLSTNGFHSVGKIISIK
ncbi:MAG TPA: T9SS type A sorting domain-containing protein [bacterium]